MNSSCQQAVYFIAEIVLKSTVVARFKLHHGLTVTCSEIGNKNIPLSVGNKRKEPSNNRTTNDKKSTYIITDNTIIS